jgi:hypothetical protein
MPPGQAGQPELHDVYVMTVFLRLAVALFVVNGTVATRSGHVSKKRGFFKSVPSS